MNNYKLLVYNPLMWTLDQLITFQLVAEKESFSKAAAHLNLSTAAVGKQIKSLESEIGAQLFYRTTRHVNLTEMGKAFFARSKIILDEIDKTKDFIAEHNNEVRGTIKIVSSIPFGESHIVPHLHELLTLYPNLTIDLDLTDRIPNLAKEEVDLTIGLMSGLPLHYTSRRIKNVLYVLCATSNYLKKFGEPKKPQELASHHFITHSNRPNPSLIMFNNDLQIKINPKLWTSNSFTMLNACLMDIGIGMFHFDTVKTYIKEKRLIEILQPYRQPPQPLYLYYKTMQYMQPKLRAVIDFLIAKLETLTLTKTTA